MSGLERLLVNDDGFAPVERVAGDAKSGVLLLCDHASNALPERYGDLGLDGSQLARHIAYDIGAAWVTRRLAERLNATALLTTFSRLLIDPNRGADDPTLVMRYSDGAIVPGNARADASEIARRRALYWRPYRESVIAEIAAMRLGGHPPTIISIHSFTPIWRGHQRPWKFGVLWDMDPRLPRAVIAAAGAQLGLRSDEIGDNEPYDGALEGDTLDACATPLGLSNALLEIRQDLIDTSAGAFAFADKLAEALQGPLADPAIRAPAHFGSRAAAAVRRA